MAGEAGRPSAFSARYFGSVWVSGLLWHLSRWGVVFLGTFVINEMTGSPRLVQLAGAVMYAPLLLGGVIGGVISDRFDRLVTVRVQLGVLVPLSIGIGILVRTGRVEVWMLYVYMFIVGIGWVTDMTSRRALVFDLVGPERLDHAMAMESLSLSSGMVLGALIGGTAIAALGSGWAYFMVAGFVGLSWLVLVPVVGPEKAPSNGSSSPGRDLIEGARVLRSNRGVVSILGVTVIANMFLFAYFPMIPVIAERFNVGPARVGLLVAATGIGMMSGSLVIARLAPRARGLAYVGGVMCALAFLIVFALATRYWLVFAAIAMSGFGSGFFAATQSSLVMEAVPDQLRGRALGLLSMAIGALPIGMYVLGEVAEQTTPATGLLINAFAGALALSLWLWRRPEVATMAAAGNQEDQSAPAPAVAVSSSG